MRPIDWYPVGLKGVSTNEGSSPLWLQLPCWTGEGLINLRGKTVISRYGQKHTVRDKRIVSRGGAYCGMPVKLDHPRGPRNETGAQ